MKIATICSGIGAPEKALRNLGLDVELAYFCEFDKYAVKSYCAIHGESENKNLGDLTKVEIEKLPKDLDLIVGGTPCQDFSVAGKRAGGKADAGTRSSLMWNFVEIIRETKPRVVLWENVPGCLTAGEMKTNFYKFYRTLGELGYRVQSKILNAKYFGIPQNRDRVFLIATRRDLNIQFEMPDGYDCGIRLKHILETDVAEKYFLSDKAVQGIFNSTFQQRTKRLLGMPDNCPTLFARDYKEPYCINANALIELTQDAPQANRVYDINSIARNLVAEAGGGGAKTGLYQVPHGDCKGGFRAEEFCPTITTSAFEQNLFIVGSTQQNAAVNFDGVCPALTSAMGMGGGQVPMHNYQSRIRKLTPSECLKLMGFTDADYEACKAVEMSDSQLYKQAGNSIVVNVLMAIFGQLYGIEWREKVYGKWWRPPSQRYDDMPIMQAMNESKRGNENG